MVNRNGIWSSDFWWEAGDGEVLDDISETISCVETAST